MSRQLTQAFESYQKARQQFVQTISDAASRGTATDTLVASGAVELLRPLLMDPVASIQQTAAVALGRLANTSTELANRIIAGDVVPQLVLMMANRDRFSKKSASFVIRTLSKHSPESARTMVESGALDALVTCMEEFDPQVKESAAWALGYIARHSTELAQEVVDAGAVPLLILSLQEPEISLKRISASTLSDISKHSPELAQTVVDSGAVAYLAPLIENKDAKLRRQVFSVLSQLAKHTVELAERVVEAEVFPAALPSLRDPDEYVSKNAATLIREVVKHSPELAQLLVNTGGVAACVDYVQAARSNNKIPGIMALGYISSASERLAKAVIVSHAVGPVAQALSTDPSEQVKAAAAWTLGQMGRHSPDHAKAVAQPDAMVFPNLVALARDSDPAGDLHIKASRALVSVLQKCTFLPALEALLSADVPVDILKHIVSQFAKILPNDAQARKAFVASKGLQKIQTVSAALDSDIGQAIKAINGCYPAEVVRFYSPGYSDALLETLDSYQPATVST